MFQEQSANRNELAFTEDTRRCNPLAVHHPKLSRWYSTSVFGADQYGVFRKGTQTHHNDHHIGIGQIETYQTNIR